MSKSIHPYPHLERNSSDFPEERDTITLWLSPTSMIEVALPLGHASEEVDVRFSEGDGWRDLVEVVSQ